MSEEPFAFLSLPAEIQYIILDYIRDIPEKFHLRLISSRFRDLVDTKESWATFNRLSIEKKQFYSHYIVNGLRIFEQNIYQAVSDLCQRITVTHLTLNASPEVPISPESLARLIQEIHRPENRTKLTNVRMLNAVTPWMLPSLIAFAPSLKCVIFERNTSPLSHDQSIMFWHAIRLGKRLSEFSYFGARSQDMETHRLRDALTGKPILKLHLESVGHLYTETLIDLCQSFPKLLQSLSVIRCPNVSAVKLVRHLDPKIRNNIGTLAVSLSDESAQNLSSFLLDFMPNLEQCTFVKEGDINKFEIDSMTTILGQLLASIKSGRKKLKIVIESESNALAAIRLLEKDLCQKLETETDEDQRKYYVATSGEASIMFPFETFSNE